MSRAKAAQRVAASNVAASLAALLSPARAEASRKNGAKSRGPKTPEGKARTARNALKHGLCAEHHVVVEGESPDAFVAFEAALVADLAPEGALQTLLAGRIARAAWRLERAERIEAELFARQMDGPFGDGDLGLALIRDGNGARAFDTLLRYRGAAQAEFSRALHVLKALQAERAAREPAPASPPALPNKPDARGNPGELPRATAAAGEVGAVALAPLAHPSLPVPAETAACARPMQPAQRQGTPSAPSFPSQCAAVAGSASLLAGTALVPIGRLGNGD
jgi:hypothetical protein